MIFAIILFLSLVIATFWRINTAIETHPGLVVKDAYRSGQSYGKILALREKINKEGWDLKINRSRSAISPDIQNFIIAHAPEKSLKGYSGTAFFIRPLEKKLDFELPLKLDQSNFQVTLPKRGRWRLVIELTNGSSNLIVATSFFYK
jgi:nitrogen fixation protein FixH